MPVEQASADVRRKAAREVIDILHEIATLLVGVYQHLTWLFGAPQQLQQQ
jgi:hypothetical protein